MQPADLLQADALAAYRRTVDLLRDELGIEKHALAKPFQAAWISATSFAT